VIFTVKRDEHMQWVVIVFLFLIAVAVWLYNLGQKDSAEFLLHVITAFGVISAVAIAVYGERIKRLWNSIDLSIENPEEPTEWQRVTD
jgi:membrane associated rhomboid family serine protease